MVLVDETIADLGDVHPLPVELFGLRLEIGFHIVKKFTNLDFVCDELRTFGIAEAEVDRGATAGGLGHRAFELAPIADDLVEPILVVGPDISLGALDGFAPVLGSAGVLAAVLEDLT